MSLTERQRTLLGAASQRDDRLLPRPDKITGAALAKAEASLVRAGFAEALTVDADQPAWRRDERNAPIGLRATPAGLDAIGFETSLPIDAGGSDRDGLERQDPAVTLPVEPRQETADTRRTFRPGSKSARLVALLEAGTTVDDLVAALSWQPHTVRAALTRLRQGGFCLVSDKNERNKTVYRIAPAPDAIEGSPVEVG